MNEKTTIRFVLTGVKYSQSDLGKHYKTFCGLYLPPIKTPPPALTTPSLPGSRIKRAKHTSTTTKCASIT